MTDRPDVTTMVEHSKKLAAIIKEIYEQVLVAERQIEDKTTNNLKGDTTT